jgi:hypothetical protein
MEPFKGHQAIKPSITHQAIKPSISHRVRIFLHLPPFPFLKKGKFGSLVALFLRTFFFNSNLKNTCSHNLFEEKKND